MFPGSGLLAWVSIALTLPSRPCEHSLIRICQLVCGKKDDVY
ncbi:hypothetical protein EI42_03024 [Thermosporothrix hazakensis]|jgi:hypothetical protein|uniref:Uncharacterized protein n=1 Tax=Thermosporothrix hazakensis TaxID=644383 RepID=A0A326U6Z2_THEHA|nr:hypothetical protein EI42_03024 [Thermosporothrix hazakensis]